MVILRIISAFAISLQGLYRKLLDNYRVNLIKGPLPNVDETEKHSSKVIRSFPKGALYFSELFFQLTSQKVAQ